MQMFLLEVLLKKGISVLQFSIAFVPFSFSQERIKGDRIAVNSFAIFWSKSTLLASA